MMNLKEKPFLILDFGSQYTQLIARRVREMGVYCEIYPYNLSEESFLALDPCGVILSGGPASASLAHNPQIPAWIFESELPLLGICYGMQSMATQLGGTVASSTLREYGHAKASLDASCRLFEDIASEGVLDVWMSHGDEVTKVPPGFKIICSTRNAAIAGMAHEIKPWYGLQFHPEVTHTQQGMLILQQFILTICHAKPLWTSSNIIEKTIDTIREQVGSDQVLLGLSGGVDSSVAAALIHKAIGKQLICIFVDNGLLRLDEKEQVLALFKSHLNLQIITIDAGERFLVALKGERCPEQKRKIIGRVFIEVFEEEAKKWPQVKWLGQGTIYPDVIESAVGLEKNGSEVIKSHHNVGGLPNTMQLKLLEPLRALFKDEVRKIGLELGLPAVLINRHPFPGPGLGVRILEEIKAEYLTILRQADAIFIEELYKAELYHQVSQAFAVFLPVKSVGVMGDGRRYDYVISLRAVETIDFMTAHWAHLPWEFLGLVSNRIINEVVGVSRVVYDISGKPPATIEWE